MAGISIRRLPDGSFDMPENWIPAGDELEVILERAIEVARETKSATKVCQHLGLRPLLVRQMRITNIKFQIDFDIALMGHATPRHLVGKPGQDTGDIVDQELKTVKSDGTSRKARIPFTADLYPIAAAEIERSGSLQRAADVAGVSLAMLKRGITDDPQFSEMSDTSMRRYGDSIREVARQRATEGYLVPIIGGKDRNEIVAYEPKYSDKLLELELKRVDPSYRDHRIVEQTSNVNIKQTLDLGSLSPRARAKLKELLLIIKEEAEVEKTKKLEAFDRTRALGGELPVSELPIIDTEGMVIAQLGVPPAQDPRHSEEAQYGADTAEAIADDNIIAPAIRKLIPHGND